MSKCRDRLFKAVQATMGNKPGKDVYHPTLETVIESKEDAATAVKMLLNHDGYYNKPRR